ncbi:Lsr2 family DNA-binding protein [Sphaerimonospora mesophila]
MEFQGSWGSSRRWARDNGLDVSDRGRLRPEILLAYERAHEG